jgi:hypothetical protein
MELMRRQKKATLHRCKYINITERLVCSVCRKEAPKKNILESSLRKAFTKKGILEYYNISKEQAKDLFVYTVRNLR